MPNTYNLALAADRSSINTVVDYINNSVYSSVQDGLQNEYYYSQFLLDKIKLANDDMPFMRLATTREVPAGNKKFKLKRWGALTAHTTPLIEGIPPQSDKTILEEFEGTYHQYGRFMEFSDLVDWNVLDPVIMEYTSELSDVATRTFERLARNELLKSTFQVYANAKSNTGALTLQDQVGLVDYRLAALQMKRLMVKPIGGLFKVIISEEHKYDLLEDPLVIDYLGKNNGISTYATGEIPTLFGISFETTMFDDFAYGYQLANPGEWDNSGTPNLRIYAVSGLDTYYFNQTTGRTTYAAAEYRTESTPLVDGYTQTGADGLDVPRSGMTLAENSTNRLADGSWIPIRSIWGAHTFATDEVVTKVTDNQDGTYTTVTETVDTDVTAATLNALTWKQLPVHKSFMMGADALIKTGVSGHSGANMFVKPLGSAGVLDPINQRQSIGFKIDAVGFTLLRNEACWVFHHVPKQATLTAEIGSNRINGLQKPIA